MSLTLVFYACSENLLRMYLFVMCCVALADSSVLFERHFPFYLICSPSEMYWNFTLFSSSKVEVKCYCLHVVCFWLVMKNFCWWQDCLISQSFWHKMCHKVALVGNGWLLLSNMIQMATPLFYILRGQGWIFILFMSLACLPLHHNLFMLIIVDLCFT